MNKLYLLVILILLSHISSCNLSNCTSKLYEHTKNYLFQAKNTSIQELHADKQNTQTLSEILESCKSDMPTVNMTQFKKCYQDIMDLFLQKFTIQGLFQQVMETKDQCLSIVQSSTPSLYLSLLSAIEQVDNEQRIIEELNKRRKETIKREIEQERRRFEEVTKRIEFESRSEASDQYRDTTEEDQERDEQQRKEEEKQRESQKKDDEERNEADRERDLKELERDVSNLQLKKLRLQGFSEEVLDIFKNKNIYRKDIDEIERQKEDEERNRIDAIKTKEREEKYKREQAQHEGNKNIYRREIDEIERQKEDAKRNIIDAIRTKEHEKEYQRQQEEYERSHDIRENKNIFKKLIPKIDDTDITKIGKLQGIQDTVRDIFDKIADKKRSIEDSSDEIARQIEDEERNRIDAIRTKKRQEEYDSGHGESELRNIIKKIKSGDIQDSVRDIFEEIANKKRSIEDSSDEIARQIEDEERNRIDSIRTKKRQQEYERDQEEYDSEHGESELRNIINKIKSGDTDIMKIGKLQGIKESVMDIFNKVVDEGNQIEDHIERGIEEEDREYDSDSDSDDEDEDNEYDIIIKKKIDEIKNDLRNIKKIIKPSGKKDLNQGLLPEETKQCLDRCTYQYNNCLLACVPYKAVCGFKCNAQRNECETIC